MKVTPIDPNTRFRMGHNTGEVYVLPHLQPGDVIEGTQIFTASSSLVNGQGVTYQIPGDQWLNVQTVNGEPRSGWVALTNMGESICVDITNGTEIFLKYTVEVYSDGSLVINGIPYP